MALAFYFHSEGFTADIYDQVIKDLEAAGAAAPKGRLHHSAFGPPEGLMIYDVWTSQEDFNAFGETLMPIMEKHGIDVGQPDVMPVHNMIQ